MFLFKKKFFLFLFFFGAKKRNFLPSFSLAQRKEAKETSTLTKFDFVDFCRDSG